MTDIDSLHRIERNLLPILLKRSSVEEIVAKEGIDHAEVMRALRWLSEKGLAEVSESEAEIVELESNGELYKSSSLPENRFLNSLQAGKKTLLQIMKDGGLSREEVNICIGLLRKSNFISVQKGNDLSFEITHEGKKKLASGFPEEALLKKLPASKASLSDSEKNVLGNLLSRKNIVKVSLRKSFTAVLTANGKKIAASPKLKEALLDRLTPQMLKDGLWKNQKFRPYNLTQPAPRIFSGKKQPYRAFLDEVRRRFTALGFREMDGPIVESEFWDMDALFMPQFHSARDIHDAYYVKEPKFAQDIPKEILKNVKDVHEHGIKGSSKGWRYDFSIEKTKRLILRSQDTSISPRTLSSKELQVPGKYFQIARCFRYDVIDATHNADFDQIGGFVVGDSLNLRHLFGLLRMFAKEFCNTDEVKVVPSYFPFTEPSVGLYAKHPEMGWIELAGAGIFRPEMTNPLGVSKPVIAWGIGLGRVAMFRLGISDIRDLYSHDLEYLRGSRVI